MTCARLVGRCRVQTLDTYRYMVNPREFDGNVGELRASLEAAADADFGLTWKLLYGGETVDTGIREDVLRNTVNHFVHHRAQLTVYLRMNDVPLPPLYGPTADER